LGVSSISWTWAPVPGAGGYSFFFSTGGPPVNLATTTFVQTQLSTNTPYGGAVLASNPVGPGPLSPGATGFTLAAPVVGLSTSALNVSSVTVVWAPNTNPP